MKTITRMLVAIAIAMGVHAAAQAQVLSSPPHDAQADRAAFVAADRTVRDDTSPASATTQRLILAMMRVDTLSRERASPPSVMQASQEMIAARQGMSRIYQQTTPEVYTTVMPGMRRTYLLPVAYASTHKQSPGTGEPYRMVPIEQRYPVLVVPAIQSILAQGNYGRGAVASYGDQADDGTKLSSRLDHYEFDARMREGLDKGFPGASRWLAAWNATVPFSSEVRQNWTEFWDAKRKASYDSVKSTPRNEADAYSRLAPGVAARSATLFGHEYVVVTVVNSSTTPFVLRPEQYAFLAGRDLTPLIARPLSGPLQPSAALRCIDGSLPPPSPFGETDPGVTPVRDQPMTDEEWALMVEDLMSGLSKVVDKTPLGAAQSAVIAATGVNPFTRKYSFDDQKDAVQDLLVDKLLGKVKLLLPSIGGSIEAGEKIKEARDQVGEIQELGKVDQERAERIGQLKDLRQKNLIGEQDRVATENAIRVRHAAWMRDTYWARWNDRLSSCGGTR